MGRKAFTLIELLILIIIIMAACLAGGYGIVSGENLQKKCKQNEECQTNLKKIHSAVILSIVMKKAPPEWDTLPYLLCPLTSEPYQYHLGPVFDVPTHISPSWIPVASCLDAKHYTITLDGEIHAKRD